MRSSRSSRSSNRTCPSSTRTITSDPVEKMGIGYAALWNAFKRLTAGTARDEKLAMFSGTARRAYRLA